MKKFILTVIFYYEQLYYLNYFAEKTLIIFEQEKSADLFAQHHIF